MHSLENVTKSNTGKNALQKNCDLFQHLATEDYTLFFLFFSVLNIHVTLAYCFTTTLGSSSVKNKKAPNVNWVDSLFLSLFLFQRNIIAMLISANNGSVTSYMFPYLLMDKSNLFKALFQLPVGIEGPGFWPVTLAFTNLRALLRGHMPCLYFLKENDFIPWTFLYILYAYYIQNTVWGAVYEINS